MQTANRVIALIAVGITVMFLLYGCFGHVDTDYKECKERTVRFLDENEDKLVEFAEGLMSQEHGASGKFKGEYYGGYHDESRTGFGNSTRKYVQIDIDAYGMLGGQYWGLIYCPDNDYIEDGSDISIYDESLTDSGNNILIREKIKDKWYFYYDDYDGHVDTSEIK